MGFSGYAGIDSLLKSTIRVAAAVTLATQALLLAGICYAVLAGFVRLLPW